MRFTLRSAFLRLFRFVVNGVTTFYQYMSELIRSAKDGLLMYICSLVICVLFSRQTAAGVVEWTLRYSSWCLSSAAGEKLSYCRVHCRWTLIIVRLISMIHMISLKHTREWHVYIIRANPTTTLLSPRRLTTLQTAQKLYIGMEGVFGNFFDTLLVHVTSEVWSSVA